MPRAWSSAGPGRWAAHAGVWAGLGGGAVDAVPALAGRGAPAVEWFTFAGAVTVAGLVLILFPSQYGWTGPVSPLVTVPILVSMPVAAGVAILRYRLYDIDRLINQTLVYGLLTALLGGLCAGLVLVFGQLFGGIGDHPPSWVVAGATLAVAALFQPARRIQAIVDRRFNRCKYNATKTVAAFSAACATRSTSTPSRPSYWRPSTRPCSPQRRHCGCGRPSRDSRGAPGPKLPTRCADGVLLASTRPWSWADAAASYHPVLAHSAVSRRVP
jgi:hypothetical protein